MGTPLADLAFAGLDRNQEEELMTYFRHAAIVAAALAGATTASAQTTIITREPAESRTVVTTEPLELAGSAAHDLSHDRTRAHGAG